MGGGRDMRPAFQSSLRSPVSARHVVGPFKHPLDAPLPERTAGTRYALVGDHGILEFSPKNRAPFFRWKMVEDVLGRYERR